MLVYEKEVGSETMTMFFELIYYKSISFLDRQIYILLLHCEVWKCLRTSFVKKNHGDNTEYLGQQKMP